MNRILAVLLAPWLLTAPVQATSAEDLLSGACEVTEIAAICQVAEALESFRANYLDFLEFSQDITARLGSELVPSLSDYLAGELEGELAEIKLPEEVERFLDELAKLPKDAKQDLRELLEAFDDQKQYVAKASIEEFKKVLKDGLFAEDLDHLDLLLDTERIEEACSPAALGEERACKELIEARKAALKRIQASIDASVKTAAELQQKTERDEQLQKQLDRAKTTYAAQISAKRSSELAEEAFKVVEGASKEAQKLRDNAQNAVSTRAAVQVVAEGLAALMDKNVTTLALVQSSLAELARQNVYTNQQISHVAEAVVKETAEQYHQALEESDAISRMMLAQAEQYLKEGERYKKEAKRVFDDSCFRENPDNWIDACAGGGGE